MTEFLSVVSVIGEAADASWNMGVMGSSLFQWEMDKMDQWDTGKSRL